MTRERKWYHLRVTFAMNFEGISDVAGAQIVSSVSVTFAASFECSAFSVDAA